MRTKTILSTAIVFSLLLASSAFAAFTVEVSLTTKSLTENEQVSVSVSVTNTGTSTESNVVIQLAGSPTQWFGTPLVQDCSVISSIAASQSQTSTCILKPTSVGSDLTLTATAQSSVTTGSGSTGGISVSSQSASLTASVSASSSVATSTVFYVSVSVTAPSTTDASNVRATISESGACTVDTSAIPASQSLGTVTKGTTKSPSSWKLTSSSSSGTCSVTVSIASDNLGSANPSKSITVGSGGGSGTTTTTSTGGSTGGVAGNETVKVNITRGNATITVPTIAAGKMAIVNITKTEDVAVRQITISVKNSVNAITINVNKLSGKPASISQEVSGKVYHYIEIKKSGMQDKDVDKVKIKFAVSKSWINENNIDSTKISLNRYTAQWDNLATTKVGETVDEIEYEAEAPGLSYFAISGEAKAVSEGVPIEEGEKPLGGVAGASQTWMILGILVILVASIMIIKKKNRVS